MVGLALADADGKWTQVNERLCLILGRSREELTHLTLGEVTAENDRRELDEALALLRSGDISRWEGELNQVRSDGSYVPVALSIATVPPDCTRTSPAICQTEIFHTRGIS